MKFYYLLFFLSFSLINLIKPLPCNSRTKCAYRISRLDEDAYLMVKNILNNLYEQHWRITTQFLNFYFHTQLKECDNFFDYKAVKQVISNDFRHPNSLFEKIPLAKINKTVKLQYEINWLDRYKMIKYGMQPFKYVEHCNSIGLKLHYLIHDFTKNQQTIFKCSSGYEETVSNLVDYYIAQTLMKNCDGNLEMLAHGIYKYIFLFMKPNKFFLIN